jgi:hypothetical protein
MVLLHNYSDLVTKKIIIKKTQIHSEKFKTQEIKYKVKKNDGNGFNLEKLYFQTPYLFLRYGPQSYEGSYDSKIVMELPISVKNNFSPNEDEEDDGEYDEQHIEFYQVLKKIHKSLKTKLIKKEKESLTGDVLEKVKINKKKKRNAYIECLKEKPDLLDPNYTHYHLKTKIHTLNGKPFWKIYHSNKKLNKEQKLRMYHYTRFIIHLESIWFFEDSYGFNWYIVQAEIKLPSIPNSYHFFRERGEDKEEIEEEIDYENAVVKKFSKMKQMGIPQIVIENKMRMCGLDPRILFANPHAIPLVPCASSAPIPPPPPPPPPINMMAGKNPPPLPPPIPGGNKTQPTPRKEAVTTQSFRPSLGQLLEMRKKLKKVSSEEKK